MREIDQDWGEVVDAHLQQKGVCAVSVKDGTVFVFTAETLRKLLEHAETAGDVIVMVPHGRPN